MAKHASFTATDLSIERSTSLKTKPDDIGSFGVFTDHMLEIDFDVANGGWGKPKIHPFGSLSLVSILTETTSKLFLKSIQHHHRSTMPLSFSRASRHTAPTLTRRLFFDLGKTSNVCIDQPCVRPCPRSTRLALSVFSRHFLSTV